MSTPGKAGILYILRNPSLIGDPLKIGLTRTLAEVRGRSLNTATPADFEVVDTVPVRDVRVAEKRVHLMLDEVRTAPNKEFFNVSKTRAIETIKLIAAYEDEDGSIADYVGLHNDFGSRKHVNMRSVQHIKLIYALMGSTTNITFVDRLTGIRRGIVDGFLSHPHFAKHLGISSRQAATHFKNFHANHQQLLTRFYPEQKKPFEMKVFTFLRYHKGELAWKFTDDYRLTFMNPKL